VIVIRGTVVDVEHLSVGSSAPRALVNVVDARVVVRHSEHPTPDHDRANDPSAFNF
jgi:hypothetical protein